MLKTVKGALYWPNGSSKNQEHEPSNIVTTTTESPEPSPTIDDSVVSKLDVQALQISTSPSPSPTEPSSPPSSPKTRALRISFKKIIGSFTLKEAIISPTPSIDSDSTTPTSDNIIETEETIVVTFSTTAAILVAPEPASSPSSSISSISHEYPGTINAKMVKEHSDKQNLEGLKHALRAAIEKSSAAKQSGRLFNGGILTSANHKKWYHSSMPINWIQKISSEYHFGNYVITDRKTSATSWEDMPIYARIGMHLIFSCVFDHKLLKSSKIRKLFSVESVNQGKHFDAPESVAQIPHFIKAYKLDLSELLLPSIDQYTSFNQFFYRKLRPDTRPIHEVDNPNIVVSAADCRLCVFESISAATQVWIKGKSFSVQNLVNDDALAAEFEGGSIGIFRLAPQDYHRFHSPVQGTVVADPTKIPGTYFTVNPMAVNDCVDVFTENVRKVSVLDLDQSKDGWSEQFNKCVFVSIGALLVGSIELTGAGTAGNKIKKGDELGYFAYGGSTCILLFKKEAVKFDQDLVTTSLRGVETLVRMGERIGARA